MKLHDKNLVAFASSPCSIDRAGYIEKRGELNRAFQKRWFVLKGNLLFYFDKKDDKEPIGVIVLENFAVDLCDDDDEYSFKVVFLGEGGREYIMRAESQEQMEAWMRSISSASYEYITLMVAALQKQLDEVTAAAAPGAQLVDLSEAPPVAPPRQKRVNPFHQTVAPAAARCATFRELHDEVGRVIQYDRANWWSQHGRQLAASSPPLIDL